MATIKNTIQTNFTSKGAQKTVKETEQIGKAQTRLGQASASAGRSFAAQSKGLGGLVGIYASAAANIFALSAAFEALNASAQFETIIRGTNALAAGVGESGMAVISSIKEITGGQLSIVEASKAANLALSSGFSKDQIEQIAGVALKASKALGRDLTDSYQRLTRGIIKLEPELLDELGIFTRIDPAVQKYAASVNKSVTDLTQFERRQAFANAVLEEGTNAFKDIDTSVRSTQEVFSTLAANFSDLAIQAGSVVADTLKPFAEFLDKNLGNRLILVGAVGALVFGALKTVISTFAVAGLGALSASLSNVADNFSKATLKGDELKASTLAASDAFKGMGAFAGAGRGDGATIKKSLAQGPLSTGEALDVQSKMDGFLAAENEYQKNINQKRADGIILQKDQNRLIAMSEGRTKALKKTSELVNMQLEKSSKASILLGKGLNGAAKGARVLGVGLNFAFGFLNTILIVVTTLQAVLSFFDIDVFGALQKLVNMVRGDSKLAADGAERFRLSNVQNVGLLKAELALKRALNEAEEQGIRITEDKPVLSKKTQIVLEAQLAIQKNINVVERQRILQRQEEAIQEEFKLKQQRIEITQQAKLNVAKKRETEAQIATEVTLREQAVLEEALAKQVAKVTAAERSQIEQQYKLKQIQNQIAEAPADFEIKKESFRVLAEELFLQEQGIKIKKQEEVIEETRLKLSKQRAKSDKIESESAAETAKLLVQQEHLNNRIATTKQQIATDAAAAVTAARSALQDEDQKLKDINAQSKISEDNHRNELNRLSEKFNIIADQHDKEQKMLKENADRAILEAQRVAKERKDTFDDRGFVQRGIDNVSGTTLDSIEADLAVQIEGLTDRLKKSQQELTDKFMSVAGTESLGAIKAQIDATEESAAKLSEKSIAAIEAQERVVAAAQKRLNAAIRSQSAAGLTDDQKMQFANEQERIDKAGLYILNQKNEALEKQNKLINNTIGRLRLQRAALNDMLNATVEGDEASQRNIEANIKQIDAALVTELARLAAAEAAASSSIAKSQSIINQANSVITDLGKGGASLTLAQDSDQELTVLRANLGVIQTQIASLDEQIKTGVGPIFANNSADLGKQTGLIARYTEQLRQLEEALGRIETASGTVIAGQQNIGAQTQATIQQLEDQVTVLKERAEAGNAFFGDLVGPIEAQEGFAGKEDITAIARELFGKSKNQRFDLGFEKDKSAATELSFVFGGVSEALLELNEQGTISGEVTLAQALAIQKLARNISLYDKLVVGLTDGTIKAGEAQKDFEIAVNNITEALEALGKKDSDVLGAFGEDSGKIKQVVDEFSKIDKLAERISKKFNSAFKTVEDAYLDGKISVETGKIARNAQEEATFQRQTLSTLSDRRKELVRLGNELGKQEEMKVAIKKVDDAIDKLEANSLLNQFKAIQLLDKELKMLDKKEKQFAGILRSAKGANEAARINNTLRANAEQADLDLNEAGKITTRKFQSSRSAAMTGGETVEFVGRKQIAIDQQLLDNAQRKVDLANELRQVDNAIYAQRQSNASMERQIGASRAQASAAGGQAASQARITAAESDFTKISARNILTRKELLKLEFDLEKLKLSEQKKQIGIQAGLAKKEAEDRHAEIVEKRSQLVRERVQQINEEKSDKAMLIAQQELQIAKDAQAKAEQLQQIENLKREQDQLQRLSEIQTIQAQLQRDQRDSELDILKQKYALLKLQIQADQKVIDAGRQKVAGELTAAGEDFNKFFGKDLDTTTGKFVGIQEDPSKVALELVDSAIKKLGSMDRDGNRTGLYAQSGRIFDTQQTGITDKKEFDSAAIDRQIEALEAAQTSVDAVIEKRKIIDALELENLGKLSEKNLVLFKEKAAGLDLEDELVRANLAKTLAGLGAESAAIDKLFKNLDDEYKYAISNQERMKNLAESLGSTIANTLGAAVTQFFDNVASGASILDGIGNLFTKMLMDIQAQVLQQTLVDPFVKSITGSITGAIGGSLFGLPVGPGKSVAAGGVVHMAQGGQVNALRDRVPAMLEPGEFVIRKNSAKSIGRNNLNKMNDTGSSGMGNVEFNIVNNGAPKEAAQQGPPKIDTDKIVIDVVMRDLSTNGPIRKALRSG